MNNEYELNKMNELNEEERYTLALTTLIYSIA